MKERYISLMAKALSAYSDEHILDYFDRVKREGLTEHGFPRLSANIGILICHGIRKDLFPLFCDMMDFCCHQIPRVKAANDFSVKEIIFCILELENAKLLPQERIDAWKAELATIRPETCYNRFAVTPQDRLFNWCLFTTVSEYMRQYIGLCDASEFIDIQIPTQLHWFDENGMYRDHLTLPPLVYDLVPRGLFAIMLHFGYRGRFYEEIDRILKKSGLLTLDMQSVTGELPFGGRSNQFMHNEAHLSIILEYEARRYAAEGNLALAAKFKRGVLDALDNIALWLDKNPIRHVKNRYPTETMYGCERYAYFDKYMITAASFLYVAYLICDDTIEAAPKENRTLAFSLSDHFHKTFLRCDPYFVEIEPYADPHYEACGIGRIHRADAPSEICLTDSCPQEPRYTVDVESPLPFAIAPGIEHDGKWLYALDKTKVIYEPDALDCDDGVARSAFYCRFVNESAHVHMETTVREDGVTIALEGNGKLRCLLPAFCFDGETSPVIRAEAHTLEVAYRGWICRYTTNGVIEELSGIACNRSGHYRPFAATAEDGLSVHVEIVKE